MKTFNHAVRLLAFTLPATIANADDTRATYETEFDATADRVWEAFTTNAGLRSWMAPLVEIDLAVGGKIAANYNAQGKLGDETTIENTILAYDPGRMLSLKVTRFPAGFPFVEAARETWAVFYFTELSPTRSKVTVVGLGYTGDDDSQKLRAFFDVANAESLDKLKAALKTTQP